MVDDPDDQTTDFHRQPVQDDAARFDLTVTAGPDTGATHAVDSAEPMRLLVGKSPICEIKLSDPRVSRRHMALEVRRGRLHVTDLGSTNGTTVNSVFVLDAELVGGERIRVGDTTIEVARARPADATPSRRILPNFGPTYGESAAMQRLYPLCQRLATSDVPIVIEGETGTGKEVLAESIHIASRRAGHPFVVFDCTTVPGNLMEAELFGHEKGAFTGAASARKGVFEQAEGGTLLIDEIGDLDIALQPKLLRAVERRQVRRLGGTNPIVVDVRLIAATRRDLDREVAAGRFRDDLFHRLAVARVELPPLRERVGDVRVLVDRFCEELGVDSSTIPTALMAQWEDASWPGNLRELRNSVARWVALGEMESLHSRGNAPRPSGVGEPDEVDKILELRLPFADSRQRLVTEFERRYVERVLAEADGNVSKAAAASGIGRRYFHMLIARHVKR